MRESDERRKEETEKYHGASYRIVGFAGKRFLFFPPPPPSFLFSWLLSLSNFRAITRSGRSVYCTAASCYVACSDHYTRKRGGAGVIIIFFFFLNSADSTISEPGTSYLLQPRPQVDFSWGWRWAPHLQSHEKSTWGRGCTYYADHEPIITDQGWRGVLHQYLGTR